jgi:hypothetical protein
MEKSPFREVWVEIPDGQSMCALINDEWGRLMYLRYKGDAGFSSRNINYEGPAEPTIEYRLDNGQHGEHPASWAYPVYIIEHALHFSKHSKRHLRLFIGTMIQKTALNWNIKKLTVNYNCIA